MPITVLGIDQAKVSGWALFSAGRYVASGVATTALERDHAVRRAAAFPLEHVWLYLEDHGDTTRHALGARKRGREPMVSAASILSLGAARGAWQQAWEMVGGLATHRQMVKPRVWRKAVLSLPGSVSRDDAKRAAVRWAADLWRVSVTHDEAEAMAIAWYGSQRETFLQHSGATTQLR